MNKERNKTRLACYLVGFKGDQILLGQRQNTGHMDGCWSLVAGHVHEREPATKALMRECWEECGLVLSEHEFTCMGVMHHQSGAFDYINFIYTCNLEGKKIENREPHKCSMLGFYPKNRLPQPMEDYIRYIIDQAMASRMPWIVEYGWD